MVYPKYMKAPEFADIAIRPRSDLPEGLSPLSPGFEVLESTLYPPFTVLFPPTRTHMQRLQAVQDFTHNAIALRPCLAADERRLVCAFRTLRSYGADRGNSDLFAYHLLPEESLSEERRNVPLSIEYRCLGITIRQPYVVARQPQLVQRGIYRMGAGSARALGHFVAALLNVNHRHRS